MKRALRSALVLLAAAAVLAPAAAAKKSDRARDGVATRVDDLAYPPLPDIELPEPERFTLDNGLEVLMLENHELPLVSAVAYIRTGSRLEPADKVGLAGLTGTVMRTGGTVDLSSDELNERLEDRAAVIETSIGETSGRAVMSALREDFEEVLGLFADVLRNPAFEDEQITVARNQIEAGIARQNDDPGQILGREFQELILGESSPYARPVTYATVRGITRDDLLGWHRRYFHPDRTILALVGDFEIAAARAAVERAFGDWPRGGGEVAKPPEVALAAEPGVYFIEKSDVNQSNIRIGHLGIRRDNPDYYAVEVMNQVLGGSFAARLFTNVRSKKGLAYSVSGGVRSSWDHRGLFTLSTSTKTETTVAAIEALLEEARNMTANPPTEDEVSRAKQGLLNSFVFSADDLRDIVSQQLTYAYYGYPQDWMSRYQKGIEAVTVEQVRAAAAKYIDPERFAILVVGPREGTDKPLSALGEVTEIDISIPEPPAESVAATAETRARGAELIAAAVAAVGGAERLDAVAAVRIRAANTLVTPQGSFDVASDTVTVFPDRQRTEMTLPFGTVIQTLAGEGSWLETPQGIQDMPASMREDMEKSVRRTLINLLQQRDGESFEAVAAGGDTVGGTAVERVQVRSGGETVTLGIDPATGRVLLIAYRGQNPAGVPGDLRLEQDDFREVDGLTLPFAGRILFDGEPMLTSTVESIELNPQIDEGAFDKPE